MTTPPTHPPTPPHDSSRRSTVPSSEKADAARAATLASSVRVGIITALSEEFAAVRAMLEGPVAFSVEGRRGGREYVLGEIPAQGGGTHVIALICGGMGNNQAAASAALLLERFAEVEALLMVGIAGGVPHPTKPEHHVRLGDVVVSSSGGIVQYDFDKETIDSFGAPHIEHRHPVRPPGARLLEAVRCVDTEELSNHFPWEQHIARAAKLRGSARPADVDELRDTEDPTQVVEHPHDPRRRAGMPRIFKGVIASGNKLLNNPKKRDALRDSFGVKAVEMEGSGIADATWNDEVGYLVVRGICDYCDSQKNDRWQMYAAVVAAAYSRAVLERMCAPPEDDNHIRDLTKKLTDAYARRKTLQKASCDTTQLQSEILALIRERREGAGLRAGAPFGDGRYLLESVAGRGGFAVVWRAYDQELNRRVAIKVLHGNLAGDTTRRGRFFRGAYTMAQLTHEAVVRVLQPRRKDDGYYYFVMELVEGGNLNQAVVDQRLPQAEIFPILLGVGDALAEAHAMKLVHRDVKPSNILLDENNAPKLTDFDLVMADDTRAGTRTGTGPMGSFFYAAPECWTAPHLANARADVFGLGMTALFMLYGPALPSIRDPASVIDDLNCPTRVKVVLKRAVEWDREKRFEDAAAFCAELRQALLEADKKEEGADQQSPTGGTALAETTERQDVATARAEALPKPATDRNDEPSGDRHWKRPLSPTALLVIMPTSFVVAFVIWIVIRWTPIPTGSCPQGMIFVRGGTFDMGSESDTSDSDEKPLQRDVQVESFCMDMIEVTVGAYTACQTCGAVPTTVEGQYYTNAENKENWSKLCNGRHVDTRGDHPINCVSWDQANDYCGKAGKRLPTEREWEYAARGTEGREYPWGSAPPSAGRLNACGSECSGDEFLTARGIFWSKMYDEDDKWPSTAPAGSFPKGGTPRGLLDMAGNVWEWVSDEYCADYSKRGCNNKNRVLRGGSWTDGLRDGRPYNARSANRKDYPAIERDNNAGFRCADDL